MKVVQEFATLDDAILAVQNGEAHVTETTVGPIKYVVCASFGAQNEMMWIYNSDLMVSSVKLAVVSDSPCLVVFYEEEDHPINPLVYIETSVCTGALPNQELFLA